MVWKRTFWIIANLDSEFPGWRKTFMCEGGHPLFDIYQELIDANNKEHIMDEGHLGRSFYRDRSMDAEGVKFLCNSHWMRSNPSAFLLMYAGYVGRYRPNQERRKIIKKAFAYANKHGYEAAHNYLKRFKVRNQ